MKKLIALILLMGVALTFSACGDKNGKKPVTTTEPESNVPEITLQEVYEAGKSYLALLGDHESVYIKVTSNGAVLNEAYYTKQYSCSYYSAEYMNMGFEFYSFTTDHSEYVCFDGTYAFNATFDENGMMDMADSFAGEGTKSFISSDVASDPNATIVEKDGYITVTCIADAETLELIGNNVTSCVETYTLDAKTREMLSVKTVYTYEDGTVEEGVATITRDVEMPEGMKAFLNYDNESENLRTVTFVSNPGEDNEKVDTVQLACGLGISVSPYWEIEEMLDMYTDAECTQPFVEDDLNSDVTVYLKWSVFVEE